MTYLFAAFLVAIFWSGYWLGWTDAKSDANMAKLFERLEAVITQSAMNRRKERE